MLTHIVLFRRKAGIAKDADIESQFFERLRHLDQQIDLIRGWKLNANELDRPTSWLYVLESRFESVEALDAYLKHPAHQAVVADLKAYFEWAACDYSEGLLEPRR